MDTVRRRRRIARRKPLPQLAIWRCTNEDTGEVTRWIFRAAPPVVQQQEKRACNRSNHL